MTTLAEKIAVMQAYERGEKIEFRQHRGKDDWKRVTSPVWDWSVCDYRVAAENQPIDLTCNGVLFLKPDRRYVGTIWLPNERPYALVLLPGEIEDANWEHANKWATEQGGVLPNRVESALLCATLKDEFKSGWHWTREQHNASDASAWCQGFGNGGQTGYLKLSRLRARAIKRIPL